MTEGPEKSSSSDLRFFGGLASGVIPFIVFVAGVITIALSGAPDEKGFWPVLILALLLGLVLSRDRRAGGRVARCPQPPAAENRSHPQRRLGIAADP